MHGTPLHARLPRVDVGQNFFFFPIVFVAPGDVPTPSWGVFTIHILFTVLHSNFTVFMVYCHENKVWYWVLFVIPHPLERIETAILASYPSAAEALVLVLIGSGIPLGEPTVMMVPLRSIHYVQ